MDLCRASRQARPLAGPIERALNVKAREKRTLANFSDRPQAAVPSFPIAVIGRLTGTEIAGRWEAAWWADQDGRLGGSRIACAITTIPITRPSGHRRIQDGRRGKLFGDNVRL